MEKIIKFFKRYENTKTKSIGILIEREWVKPILTALEKQLIKKPINNEEFGKCASCGYEFNSELISEYDMGYCINCGQKLE